MKNKKTVKKVDELTTLQVMDNLMMGIALGTRVVKKTEVMFNQSTGKFETFTVDTLPTHADQIAAIEHIYKRMGQYAH